MRTMKMSLCALFCDLLCTGWSWLSWTEIIIIIICYFPCTIIWVLLQGQLKFIWSRLCALCARKSICIALTVILILGAIRHLGITLYWPITGIDNLGLSGKLIL